MHTEDGSAWEVALASSQQNKHTELTPGAPGLGKSVLINALSEIQIASAQKNLPFIAYIDKGFSAQGLVQLIRDSLPEQRKDEAVGIILSNDPDHTRNLFDVMYGARKPVTPERTSWSPSSVHCVWIPAPVSPVIPATPGKSSAAWWTWPSGNMARITPDFTAQVRNPGGSRPGRERHR